MLAQRTGQQVLTKSSELWKDDIIHSNLSLQLLKRPRTREITNIYGKTPKRRRMSSFWIPSSTFYLIYIYMRQKVHLGIQKLDIIPGFGDFSYIFVISRVLDRFRSYKLRFEQTRTSFRSSELLVNTSPVDLQVNIHKPKVVSKGKNGSYPFSESTPKYM